jgi:5-bromo-4-chloroindolyl phosphate hydrolysis protein
MKNGHILSAIVGGACFGIPYVIGSAVTMPYILPVSLALGVVGYGAGNLLFVDNKKNEVSIIEGKKVEEVLADAKKINANILNMINKVEDTSLQKDIREIYQIANKIIATVAKDNKKIKNVENFFTYYLPETLNLLKKYDEIENQKLGKSSEDFMKKTREMVSKIKDAFQAQLAHLYQEDIMDTSADMKVFDSMIKSDGYGDKDFKL